MLERDGVATKEQVMSRFPKEEYLVKPKAIIECYENIPCNPCTTSCPFDAITIEGDINNQPYVDFDKCTGCGICVFNCPGIAITVCQIENEKARFKIFHEFLPQPNVGEVWQGINRKGEVICDAVIEKVAIKKKSDESTLVQVLIDQAFLYDFVTIRRKV